ncbi:MAG: bifunctional 2-C-methyl-D-erythritol 4-phosphate cytidylyltransferase/2-C-methyl-D-erythritol 2,4-cyclodiphosphate synthase [Magnetospiraceae bacterium]
MGELSCVALIVAAGRGQRFGGETPKQYRMLAGAPLLRWTVAGFCRHSAVQDVRVVIHPADADLYDQAVTGLPVLPPVHGGATRQESVRLGLESLLPLAPNYVLIQDAARPFSDQVIDQVMTGLAQASAVIPALPLADSLKRAEDNRVAGTVDRANLYRVQTPQGFHFKAILEAHRATADNNLTDDAAVAEAAGIDVFLAVGTEENFKVTTQSDLSRAESLLAKRQTMETRIGTGFDVHAFGPGESVTLCGVTIPHDAGLVGHSDADVAFHAVTDALLGALAMGDIGTHFPPSDPQWEGANSAQFLSHAFSLLQNLTGRVINVDLTVICERPKIGPHRAAMTERLARVLEVQPSRVSVKATTTEGLGFTGRREGIAAQAVIAVQLPADPDVS